MANKMTSNFGQSRMFELKKRTIYTRRKLRGFSKNV